MYLARNLLPPTLATKDFPKSYTILPTLPLSLPQFYDTIDLAKEALQESAKEQGFTLVTRRLNLRRVKLLYSL
jgi:hypothetical protein